MTARELADYQAPGLEGDRLAFQEPWQAEAFALAVAAHQGKMFEWRDWVGRFSSTNESAALEAADDLNRAYFKHWLSALEKMLTSGAFVTPQEVEQRVAQWRRAYLRTPHGLPVELDAGIEHGDEADHEDAHHYHHHGTSCDGHDHHAHPQRDPRQPVFVSPAQGQHQSS